MSIISELIMIYNLEKKKSNFSKVLTPFLNMRTGEIGSGEDLAHRVTDVSMTRFVNFDDFTFQVYFQVCPKTDYISSNYRVNYG